jgi:hypothetical protein
MGCLSADRTSLAWSSLGLTQNPWDFPSRYAVAKAPRCCFLSENFKVIFHLETEVSFYLLLTQAKQQISKTNTLEMCLPKFHSDSKAERGP